MRKKIYPKRTKQVEKIIRNIHDKFNVAFKIIRKENLCEAKEVGLKLLCFKPLILNFSQKGF